MTEKAVLAGGCFWCLEAVFQPLKGVKRVVSGYAGGTGPASYDAVGTGMTGHAEAVEVSFDPQVISYRKLLELFFAFHDPTTLNRQGPDVGTQYRSAIFPVSQEQREAAEAVIADLTEKRVFGRPIVTTIEDAAFHPGESYHQDYYRRNSTQPYCAALITPKLAKLRAGYGALLA